MTRSNNTSPRRNPHIRETRSFPIPFWVMIGGLLLAAFMFSLYINEEMVRREYLTKSCIQEKVGR